MLSKLFFYFNHYLPSNFSVTTENTMPDIIILISVNPDMNPPAKDVIRSGSTAAPVQFYFL